MPSLRNISYLIGILDDEQKTEDEWKTYFIKNPLQLLIQLGEFNIQPILEVSAEEIIRLAEKKPKIV